MLGHLYLLINRILFTWKRFSYKLEKRLWKKRGFFSLYFFKSSFCFFSICLADKLLALNNIASFFSFLEPLLYFSFWKLFCQKKKIKDNVYYSKTLDSNYYDLYLFYCQTWMNLSLHFFTFVYGSIDFFFFFFFFFF